MSAEPLPLSSTEAALARRWAGGPRGPLRLEDGRPLHIVFPGVPGGASGPDFRGAILDAGGDLLQGDVEVHLRASSWRTHGHVADPAYAAVVLHVVAANDGPAPVTLHASGRRIPLLVLSPETPAFPPPFAPPCRFAAGRGLDVFAALERLGRRRLRMKAARASLLAAASGPGQALYTLVLEQLAGPANRPAFAALARWLPLAVLLERADDSPGIARDRIFAAELRAVAAGLSLHSTGFRPASSPARRIEAAAHLLAGWYPAAATPGWPAALGPGATLLRSRPAGLGRAAAIELMVNAVLPLALATAAWPELDVIAAWDALPASALYGKLRNLSAWLAPAPFTTAGRLQGGLLLHTDYCTRGRCGRCPLS